MVGMLTDHAVVRLTLLFACLGGHMVWSQVGASLTEGRNALHSGNSAAAATSFQRAFDELQAVHAPPEETLPVLVVLSTAWLNDGNLSRAERALLTAKQLGETNTPLWLKAELINNWAVLHLRLSHHAEARDELMEALALAGQSRAPQALVPNILHTLAVVETHLGQYSQALQHQQTALQLWQAFLPPDHPNVIQGLTALSLAQYLSGDAEGAHESMQTAIASARRTYGKKSPALARLLQDDAVILTRLGFKSEAKASAQEANHIGLVKSCGCSRLLARRH